MICKDSIFFTTFAAGSDLYRTNKVHSSSGLGRWPLTPETRVRFPDALQ